MFSPTPAMRCTASPLRSISSKWIVHGHSEVTGQGPLGTMRADQFHYDRASHQLVLDGHVRMTLDRKPANETRAAFRSGSCCRAAPGDRRGAGPRSRVKHDANAPINISADKFLADSNAKTGTWTGNVWSCRATCACAPIPCASMSIGKDNKPDKIFANGNVVVDSPTSGTVTGDNGVYDVVAAHRHHDRQCGADARKRT